MLSDNKLWFVFVSNLYILIQICDLHLHSSSPVARA